MFPKSNECMIGRKEGRKEQQEQSPAPATKKRKRMESNTSTQSDSTQNNTYDIDQVIDACQGILSVLPNVEQEIADARPTSSSSTSVSSQMDIESHSAGTDGLDDQDDPELSIVDSIKMKLLENVRSNLQMSIQAVRRNWITVQQLLDGIGIQTLLGMIQLFSSPIMPSYSSQTEMVQAVVTFLHDLLACDDDKMTVSSSSNVVQAFTLGLNHDNGKVRQLSTAQLFKLIDSSVIPFLDGKAVLDQHALLPSVLFSMLQDPETFVSQTTIQGLVSMALGSPDGTEYFLSDECINLLTKFQEESTSRFRVLQL
eukprot:TRINITY_DN1037_c0_g1_i1.p1 TRINITY_DN1037_c0_g1~~TRINITY_DN1037_c0_g1_i1.p1  ORF type:complete len:312 (+),score=92.98 TRINITY_DN1037_c0_g1_i1:907-1842(+)